VTVLDDPLAAVSREARPYPAEMLQPGSTGLCLFAAAFLGVNDAIHMAARNMHVTCVDTDLDRLHQMANIYPPSWNFMVSDAWRFARESRSRWDYVSVDTFTGDATDRSLRSLELWCSLARKAVTITAAAGQCERLPGTVDGWHASLFPRSSLALWLVLHRD